MGARAPRTRGVVKDGTIRYNCVENDNYIIAQVEDGEIEELHFGMAESEQLVFGLKDVKRALRDFNRELKE